jgi:transcriptional regulator with XRE-family HTH domain
MNKINQWRTDHNLSYAEMGRLLGCSRQYAHSICKGEPAFLARLYRLLAVTGLHMEDLMSKKTKRQLERQGFSVGSDESVGAAGSDESVVEDDLI